MKDLQRDRIQLLEHLQEVVSNNIITDRPQLTSKVRRENRQLKQMLKEITNWKYEIEDKVRVENVQRRLRIQKIKESNVTA